MKVPKYLAYSLSNKERHWSISSKAVKEENFMAKSHGGWSPTREMLVLLQKRYVPRAKGGLVLGACSYYRAYIRCTTQDGPRGSDFLRTVLTN